MTFALPNLPQLAPVPDTDLAAFTIKAIAAGCKVHACNSKALVAAAPVKLPNTAWWNALLRV